MIAKRFIGKEVGKGAFGLAREVKAMEAEFGKAQVINSTIGTFFGEDENLAVLKGVEETYKNVSNVDLFGYAAGVTGSPEYKIAVKKSLFGTYLDEIEKIAYVDVSASPGGTGAIHNLFKGYGEEGNTVLLPEYMWDAYTLITAANGLNYDTYKLFKDDGFNTENFKEKVLDVVKREKRVIAVINDPCQNPTGYSLSMDEWKEVIEILKEASRYGDVILLNDIAYMDYDFRGRNEAREFIKLFLNLPKNILITFAYSMSKSFTSYGLRTGALVALSSSEEIIKEHGAMVEYICRSTWSNVSRGGMALLSKVYGNKELESSIDTERSSYITLLEERGKIFEKIAKEIGLEYCPFRAGFFLTIPLEENKAQIVEELKSKKVFILPVKKGIRIALCSISTEKAGKLPLIIKETIDKYNK